MKDKLQILLVEDNVGDVVLFREALSRMATPVDLDCASDGVEAMNYLRTRQHQSRLNGLDLIVLDLNLPRKNGREVLAELNADPHFRLLPVAVLTSSRYESGVCSMHPGLCCRFYAKSADLHQLFKTVADILEFAGTRNQA